MKFFKLDRPKADTPEDREYGTWIDRADGSESGGSAPTCPECHNFLGMLCWLPPYRIEIETWGRHYAEIDRVGDYLVVSERCFEVFTFNAIKGLSDFTPVAVARYIHRRKRPKEPAPQGYLKARICLSETTVDQEASGYEWENPGDRCPVCLTDGQLLSYQKIVVDLASWQGEDIFFPKGNRALLVSERFVDLCSANDIRGPVFIPAESYSYKLYPWGRPKT